MQDVRDELVQVYRWLRPYGYNPPHPGNIPARDASGVRVTPTGACAWGENLNQAYKWTCALELSAQTTFISRQAGTC